jgi:hypothetical protein
MPQNKKHHYVPKFYLKRFTPNGVNCVVTPRNENNATP